MWYVTRNMIVLTPWVKCLLVFYPGSNFISLEAILSILFRLARSWLNIGWFSISLMIPVSILSSSISESLHSSTSSCRVWWCLSWQWNLLCEMKLTVEWDIFKQTLYSWNIWVGCGCIWLLSFDSWMRCSPVGVVLVWTVLQF